MQWALVEELSDSSLSRDIGWQREKRPHNWGSLFPVPIGKKHTTKRAWEYQAVGCQGLATSYSKKHFRMRSRNTEIETAYSSCELGNRVPVRLVQKPLGTLPWTSYLLYIYIANSEFSSCAFLKYCESSAQSVFRGYWNWKYFLTETFDKIHHGNWKMSLAEAGKTFVYLTMCGDYVFWNF